MNLGFAPMRRSLEIAIWCALLLVVAGVTIARAENRLALIIGNSGYSHILG